MLDAANRDFTINAISMDRQGCVYDYYNGHEDIINRRVKTVRTADITYKQDPLRLLRYFR